MFETVICKTGEVCKTYQQYLKSAHWKDVKARYKKSKLVQNCYVCNSSEKLEYHHRTYKNIGKERLMDIVPLCRECHQFAHDRHNNPYSRKVDLWSVTQRMKKNYYKKSPYSVRNKGLDFKPEKNMKTLDSATIEKEDFKFDLRSNCDGTFGMKVNGMNVTLSKQEMLQLYRSVKAVWKHQ